MIFILHTSPKITASFLLEKGCSINTWLHLHVKFSSAFSQWPFKGKDWWELLNTRTSFLSEGLLRMELRQTQNTMFLNHYFMGWSCGFSDWKSTLQCRRPGFHPWSGTNIPTCYGVTRKPMSHSKGSAQPTPTPKDFLGDVIDRSPNLSTANAEGEGSVLGLGRFHVLRSGWVIVPQLLSSSSGACKLQLLSPKCWSYESLSAWSLCPTGGEATRMRASCTAMKSGSPLAATRENPCVAVKTWCSQK